MTIAISVSWVNMLRNAGGGQIYKYLTGVQGYLQSPISVVFLLAAFWPRCNLVVRDMKNQTKRLCFQFKTCMILISILFVEHSNTKGYFWFQGAFSGLLAAFIPGTIRFILDSVYQPPPCGEIDDRPFVVKDIHPYYFTTMQIGLGLFVGVLVSEITGPSHLKDVSL